MEEEILTVCAVARELSVVPQRVRQLADEGKIPVQRTASGLRLFRASDVERLRLERIQVRRKEPQTH